MKCLVLLLSAKVMLQLFPQQYHRDFSTAPAALIQELLAGVGSGDQKTYESHRGRWQVAIWLL